MSALIYVCSKVTVHNAILRSCDYVEKQSSLDVVTEWTLTLCTTRALPSYYSGQEQWIIYTCNTFMVNIYANRNILYNS